MPRQRTILLIDDDRQVLDLLGAALSLKDYRVVARHDPGEALSYLKRNVPDLIICAVDLKSIDGFQLMHRIREGTRASYSPFIFIGAEQEPENVARGLRMGAREFLRKPFTVDEMLVRVEKVFDEVAKSRTAAPRFDLEGRLEMLPFAPLLSALGKQKASGRLTVSFPVEPVEGILVLVKGELQHAVFGRLVGREALMQLLTREEGTFAFVSDPHQVAPANTVEKSAAVLLNEGFRFIDEGLIRRIDVTNKAACRTFERLLEDASGEHLSPDEEVILLTRRIDETASLLLDVSADEDDRQVVLDDPLGLGEEPPDSGAWPGGSTESVVYEAEEGSVTDSCVLVAADRLVDGDGEPFGSDPFSLEGDALATSSIVIPSHRLDLAEESLEDLADEMPSERRHSIEIVEWGPGPVERIFTSLQEHLLSGALTDVQEIQLSTRSGRPLASTVEDRRRRDRIAAFTAQAINFAQRTEEGMYAELSAGDLHLAVVELPYRRLLTCLFDRPPDAPAFRREVRDLLAQTE